MKRQIIFISLLLFSVLGANAQGGKGKFLTIYKNNGQEEYNLSTGISFVRDGQSNRYAWRPVESPFTSYSSLGAAFDIKNVSSISKMFDSDNQITVDIPQNAHLTSDDIIVKAYGEEITPTDDNNFSTGAGYVSVVNKDGKIIYDSYISLDENDDTRTVEINALETAYTLLIPIFPFVFEDTPDNMLATMKSLLAELPETHALASAIDRSIVKNGYLDMSDIDPEYTAAVERIMEKLGLHDNYLSSKGAHATQYNGPIRKASLKDPAVVNGNSVGGMKLVLNSSEYLYYWPYWKCSFTAYNGNRFAYTAWLRGYKTANGAQYYNDEDMETMMERILKPQRVSTFMGTFTSWDGMKTYVTESWKLAEGLFTWDDFGFDDMTWDKTKLDFDMFFETEKDVVIVAGPADNEFMLYYNILKVVLGPVVKAFTKGINKLASNATDGQSELYESDYLVPFITDLLTDTDYRFKFQGIYENDDYSLGEKAGEILDLTWPKFQKYLEKFGMEQLNNVSENVAIKYFGFFTTAQLRKAMEDISKNWNKYLKVVEKVGDATLGFLGLTESSFYYDLSLDFGADEQLTLDNYDVSIAVGTEKYVTILSGNHKYTAESSDPEIAEAVIDGLASTETLPVMGVKITAKEIGGCEVLVRDVLSGQYAIIKVTVTDGDETPSYTSCPDNNHPHLIDLGLPSGTLWACCNVGAQKPEDYGGYYAWGETTEKSTYDWGTYTHCDVSSSFTYHDIGKDIAGTQYDAATANWGSPWVMPSREQMNELKNNCTSEWTTENGVNGRRFTGPNGASIFLPAAGYRWVGGLYNAGSYGDYWSSTFDESYAYNAWNLYFYSGNVYTAPDYRTREKGRSVRPVRKN